ncbi:hypothetical protein DIPPA_10657 [Diplonema papillatum]|nr:hypothetical protein DIPPA_10657 [Diplonema papillatum]|eukprot:gene19575-30149_t
MAAHVLAFAKERYPEHSDRLAVLLHERDVHLGLVGERGSGGQRAEAAAAGFDDAFGTSSRLCEYDIVDETFAATARSCWYIKDGCLHQAGSIGQDAQAAGQRHARRGSLLLRRDHIYSNFTLTVQFVRRPGYIFKAGGVVFCVEDNSNFYLLAREGADALCVYKVTDDVFYLLCHSKIDDVATNSVSVEVTKFDDEFRVTWGCSVLCFRDAAHKSGKVGLCARENPMLTVDFMRCQPLEADCQGRCKPPRFLVFENFAENAADAAACRAPRTVASIASVFDFPGASFGPSGWSLQDGHLFQDSNIRHTSDLDTDTLFPRGTFFLLNTRIATREAHYRAYVGGSVRCDLSGFGFVFNAIDHENAYVLRKDPARAAVLLLVVEGGCCRVAASLDAEREGDAADGVLLEVQTTVRWKSNSERVQDIRFSYGLHGPVTAEDSTFDGGGRCGFSVFNNPHFMASYVTVEALRPPDASNAGPVYPNAVKPKTSSLRDMLASQAADLLSAAEVTGELAHLPSLISRKRQQIIHQRAA